VKIYLDLFVDYHNILFIMTIVYKNDNNDVPFLPCIEIRGSIRKVLSGLQIADKVNTMVFLPFETPLANIGFFG